MERTVVTDTWWRGYVQPSPQPGTIVVHSPLWSVLPADGSEVEVRLVHRSPYWSLVDP